MTDNPDPTVRVTSYAVSCLPEDHVDAPHFTLRVAPRPGGRWVVSDGWQYLSRTGTWSGGYCWRDGDQEPETDQDFAEIAAGREAWRTEYWHDLDTALELAKRQATQMRINGRTAADVLARTARDGAA